MEIKLEDIKSPRYEQNIDKYGDSEDTCLICGRRLKGEYGLVHLLTSGYLTSLGESEVNNSQGYFAVGSECIKKVKQFLKQSIKKIAEDDEFIYSLYLSFVRYDSNNTAQVKGTNHFVKENNLNIVKLKKIVKSFNRRNHRIVSISVTNQLTGKRIDVESKFDFLNFTLKQLQNYLIEKLSIKKLSADDGPIDMVGGEEPTDTGEEDLGMEGGDLGGDMGGGDPGMGDEMGGEGMGDPGIPDVDVDWDEAEIIHTHELEDSRENQENEDIDFTHLV